MPRQLNMFKAHRQRGEKLPAPTEFAVQCALNDIIRRWLTPGWRYTHIPLGEYRSITTARRLSRMGVMKGWPDFIFTGPERAVFFMELKREGEKLSEAQEQIAEHLIASGIDYACANGFVEAVEALKARGIVLSTINIQ